MGSRPSVIPPFLCRFPGGDYCSLFLPQEMRAGISPRGEPTRRSRLILLSRKEEKKKKKIQSMAAVTTDTHFHLRMNNRPALPPSPQSLKLDHFYLPYSLLALDSSLSSRMRQRAIYSTAGKADNLLQAFAGRAPPYWNWLMV